MCSLAGLDLLRVELLGVGAVSFVSFDSSKCDSLVFHHEALSSSDKRID